MSGTCQGTLSDLCHGLQGDPGFVFHHANAFERRERQVVVDAIRYPTLPDFDQACGSGRHFEQVCMCVCVCLKSHLCPEAQSGWLC